MGDKVEKKKVRKKKADPNLWKRRWIYAEKPPSEEIEEISVRYKDHLSRAYTERETVDYWKEELKDRGFKDLERSRTLKPGDGFYLVNRGSSILVGIVGKKPLTEGANIVVSHVDSPRLDLKPRPVEADKDTGIGLLRTHYYGGIKKYHWVNIPLALKGRIFREDGTSIDVDIGTKDEDPVFLIPDLLPHLSKKAQNSRKLTDGIRGEELRVLLTSGDHADDEDLVLNVIGTLKEKFDICEEDLISSDLCLVPAFKPRDIGLDRGLIGAYGHDNRVSSFAANNALLSLKNERGSPDRWCLSYCFDKEEIGSDGPTGAKSSFVELSFYQMLEMSGGSGSGRDLRRSMSRSFVLSADVKSGMNPNYRSVQDPNNSARLGAGITITKYTGKGGKSGANDASAEMVSSIRRLYNKHEIIWQMQETGRVDMGGGGTVAKFMAERNMDVLDTGIPLLSMHSPYEILAKTDLYMANRAFGEFFRNHPVE